MSGVSGSPSGRGPQRELADAVIMLTGWGSFGDDDGDDDARRRRLRGPGVLAVQSLIMISFAAMMCVVKIVFYGGEAAAGWLAVFLPALALPVALAAVRHPPRRALGLPAGGLAAAAATLIAMLLCRGHVTGFWLAFLGLSAASLVGGVVFGFVTTARRPASA